MFNIYNLKEFLAEAKKFGYASGDNNIKKKETDGSTSIIFTKGSFQYHDNYFGGEPYGGREVAFYDNKPVYIMAYYGSVNKDFADIEDVYVFLRKALFHIPGDYPYRGPSEYTEGDYKYRNDFKGELNDFSGVETIEYKGRKVYKASYAGGLVDRRHDSDSTD